MSARKIFENNQQDERSKFGLFSPKEVEILSKLIPNDFLEVYQQRYNNVESQKQEIEEQLLYGNIDKKQEIKENKQRIDKSNLQIKEQNFKNGKLNEDISKLKKLGNEINGEIKTVNEHLKNIQMVLNTKLRENERLREKLNDIQNKIKNGELILKNPEENKEINEDEENEEEEENENNNNNESDNEEEDEI
jgi:chromosome segregation ATPase